MSIPILIMSDSPDQFTGLARITRDLGNILVTMPEFRLATLGLGGRGSQQFPWQQYQMYEGEFGEKSLLYAWNDFSRGDPGIVFTIWDLSRLLWLARPQYADPEIREAIAKARREKFKLWSYLPIDSNGPMGRLTAMARETLLGIDRILCYSPWGLEVVRNTIGKEAAAVRGATWLPHGIADVFCPQRNGTD